jgi:hypothetical protein
VQQQWEQWQHQQHLLRLCGKPSWYVDVAFLQHAYPAAASLLSCGPCLHHLQLSVCQ